MEFCFLGCGMRDNDLQFSFLIICLISLQKCCSQRPNQEALFYLGESIMYNWYNFFLTYLAELTSASALTYYFLITILVCYYYCCCCHCYLNWCSAIWSWMVCNLVCSLWWPLNSQSSCFEVRRLWACSNIPGLTIKGSRTSQNSNTSGELSV